MLRRNVDEAAGELTRPCTNKIRKRCALSSSGASDPLRKLRLKRGVVVLGRKGQGGGGPSPCKSRKMSESSWNRLADGTRSSASARKLVNALWQLNESGLPDGDAAVRRSAAHSHRRCASSMEISKRSRTKSKLLGADAERSWHDGDGEWFSDMLDNGGTMGVHSRIHESASTCSGGRVAHLHDMYNSLTVSKELVRVLANIWGPAGDLNPSTASILSALRAELDLARAHARQLIKERRRHGDEIDLLRKQLAEEAHAWKSKHREKAASTVKVVVAELDGERRSRRRAERVNAKLGKALADTESSLQAAARELERERRSRERLEKVCDELVRGASAGGAAEEMRREAERAQEELDKEREMLHLADELREERVQMKLLEARLQFEEKNTVVEQLRTELEAFLETKKDHQEQESPAAREHQPVEDSIPRADADVGEDDGEEGGGGECGADDSEGGDMHSIELNMDGNSKDGSWSYTSASKEMKASRNAASDRGAQCAADPWAVAGAFDRGESEGEQWDDGACSDRTRDFDEDAERYQAIKNLREQMLAGHGFVFLSQPDGTDNKREQDHYGLICQFEEGAFR